MKEKKRGGSYFYQRVVNAQLQTSGDEREWGQEPFSTSSDPLPPTPGPTPKLPSLPRFFSDFNMAVYRSAETSFWIYLFRDLLLDLRFRTCVTKKQVVAWVQNCKSTLVIPVTWWNGGQKRSFFGISQFNDTDLLSVVIFFSIVSLKCPLISLHIQKFSQAHRKIQFLSRRNLANWPMNKSNNISRR